MNRTKPDDERVTSAKQLDRELSPAPESDEHLVVDDLGEVKLSLSADLGRSTVLVREVIELRRGSVLPLDKLAGEMVDLYVNGVPFAKGEVVVIGDNLHVRIAEVIGPKGNYSA